MTDQDEEALYRKAVNVVMTDHKASTSYLQRKLQLGYNHAAGLIQRMETEGLVSGPNHKGVREILAMPAREPVPTITVNLDKKCAECGAGGAADNGICLACTTKAIAGEKMTSKIGKAVRDRFHTSKPAPVGDLTHDTSNSKGAPVAKSGFAKDQLKSFINRIERLNEERDALSADIREVFSEAKGTGFDTAIMRQVIRMRKLDKADFQEQEAMLDLYLTALDMR